VTEWFTVKLDNRPGALARMATALADRGVNIAGIVGIAEGALLAATGAAAAAEGAFTRALDALRRQRLRVDELDLLETWAAALDAPERRAEAAALRAQLG